MATPAVDILAGIPSVVYGLWGVLFLCLGGLNIGFNVLAGGIVLAIMIIPIITAISEEVFRMVRGIIALTLLEIPIITRAMDEVIRGVPKSLKEASDALGATRLETSL